MEEGSSFRLSAECLDEPPNSRVFVVLGKDTGEALIRERFAPFGDIQNIWLLRDKRTNESRGIAFIKFARSSQACRAMEEMHGRSLLPDTKPIKVPPPERAAPFLPGSGAGGKRARPGGVSPAPFPAWRPRREAGLGRCAPSLRVEGSVGLCGAAGSPSAGCGLWGRPVAEARLEQPWKTRSELAASLSGRQRAAPESAKPAPCGLLSTRTGADVVTLSGQSRGGFGLRGLRAWRCSSGGAAVSTTLA